MADAEVRSHTATQLAYVDPADPLDAVRVTAGDGRDVTGAALDAWRPWPGLVVLVPGIVLGMIISARPGAASAAQVAGLGLGWITLGIFAAPHIRPPVFHRGDAGPAFATPAVAAGAWLVPVFYLVLSFFVPAELMVHEKVLVVALGVGGSWWTVAAAAARGREARALLSDLAEEAPARASLWASTYVEIAGDQRTAKLPDGGARIAAGDAVLGGSADAAPRRYAELVLRHHHRRMRAGLIAAGVHTLAGAVALAL